MKSKKALRLLCLGGGKMGEALIEGLLDSKEYSSGQIQVGEPDSRRRDYLTKRYGIQALANNIEAVQAADICILAIKPQQAGPVLDEIAPYLMKSTLLISIMAGISTDFIQSRVAKGGKIVRAMPNAAAVIRKSTTGLYIRPEVNKKEKQLAVDIFKALGMTVEVEKEDHLNIITGLSGSGPAYVFLFLEALTDAGVYLGLSREVAAQLSLSTVLGSGAMAEELQKPYALLKEIITSPGGTTMAGLRVLEEEAFRAALLDAVEAATLRARELSM